MASPTARPPEAADIETLSKALGLDDAELRRNLPSLTVRQFPRGAAIVREGQVGADMFILLKGSVSVRVARWVILQKEIARLKPGDLFGEIGFVAEASRTATVVAEEDCEVLRILAPEMRGLIERKPELRKAIEEMARQHIYGLSSGS